jgi:hypothetical protein
MQTPVTGSAKNFPLLKPLILKAKRDRQSFRGQPEKGFLSTFSRKFAVIFLFEEIPDEHRPPILCRQAHQGSSP